MRYFYKYIKTFYYGGFYFAYYRDDFNYFNICNKYGEQVKTITQADVVRLARLVIDDLNGKR